MQGHGLEEDAKVGTSLLDKCGAIASDEGVRDD